jgi:hypothetical protein
MFDIKFSLVKNFSDIVRYFSSKERPLPEAFAAFENNL